MKKTIFFIVLLAALLPSCQKAKVEPYSRKNGVYFFLDEFTDFNTRIKTIVDTLSFSFVRLEETQFEAVVQVRVNLQGIHADYDRKFVIKVNREKSTAIEETDYTPLAPYYLITANEYYTMVPITIKRTSALLSKTLNMVLELEETEDLEVGLREKRTVVIKFTNMLTKPVYWDNSVSAYVIRIWGEWSRNKQLLAERLCDFEFPETLELYMDNMTRLDAYSRFTGQYVTENIVLDEDGNRILPWR